MNKSRLILVLSLASPLMAADGEALFKLRCASCHETAQAGGRIPPKAELAALPPEAIVRTLASGSMMIRTRRSNRGICIT